MAAAKAVPLPYSRPVMLVVSVIAGVVVDVATVPAKPLADTTDTLVTVPPDPVADNVPVAKLMPDPMVTLLNPPLPLPYRMDVPLVAGA